MVGAFAAAALRTVLDAAAVDTNGVLSVAAPQSRLNELQELLRDCKFSRHRDARQMAVSIPFNAYAGTGFGAGHVAGVPKVNRAGQVTAFRCDTIQLRTLGCGQIVPDRTFALTVHDLEAYLATTVDVDARVFSESEPWDRYTEDWNREE